jgi:hypothetical protein
MIIYGRRIFLSVGSVDPTDPDPTDPDGVTLPDDSGMTFFNNTDALQGEQYDDGFTVRTRLEASGSTRLVVYSDSLRTVPVAFTPLIPSTSFNIAIHKITGLQANTTYYWSINSGNQQGAIKGKIKTLATGAFSYKFAAASCAGQSLTGRVSNHEVFDAIRVNNPDLHYFMHLGDMHYKDISTNGEVHFDNAFRDVLAQQRQQDLYASMGIVYMHDDHDYGPNDSNASSPSRPASLANFRRRVPAYSYPFTGSLDPVCYSYYAGRVRYFILDARSQRIPNDTFLGAAQKQWLKDELLLTPSDHLICIQTNVPWIATTGSDTWSTGSVERAELMQFFADNNLSSRMFMIAGDAHMLAIDNGTNNAGIPMFQLASLDATGSTKGGPYTSGTFPGRGQYGLVEITDTGGSSITVKVTGYRVLDGVQSEILTFTKVFLV